MANLLPASGTLSYFVGDGGVTFDALYKTKMRGIPVYDDANRSVKFVRWTLKVSGYIGAGLASGTSTDDTLDTLRQRLTTPRGRLRYEDKGFGSFIINVAPVYDAEWGPKPKVLEFTPIGNTQTAFIEWEIEACIPECPTATYRKALMMANYEITHDYDSNRLVTATVTGAIEIPLTTHAASRAIPETVDDYRHLAWFKPGLGFKRESFTWKVSADRRRAEFTIVDKEMPYALPDGCIACDMKERVVGEGPAFISWTVELSGSIVMNPYYPRGESLNRFKGIVHSRLRRSGGGGTPPGGGGVIVPVVGPSSTTLWLEALFNIGTVRPLMSIFGGGAPAGGAPTPTPARPRRTTEMILSLEITEDIFGVTDSFKLVYVIIGDFAQMLTASGLWTPIEGTSFASYRNNDVSSPRGFSKIKVDASTETLIDLCLEKKTEPKPPTIAEPPSRTAPAELLNPRAPTQPGAAPFLAWAGDIEVFADNHLVRHKPLAGNIQQRQVSANTLGTVQGIEGAQLGGLSVQSQGAEDLIQRRQRPTVNVLLTGYAVRVDARVPTPELASFGGKTVVEAWRREKESMPGKFGGRVLYRKDWEVAYMVTDTPARIPLPANPAFGMDGVA